MYTIDVKFEGSYDVVDVGDVLAEGLECGHDHLVPDGLGDKHDVLREDGLEGDGVQVELLHALEFVRLQGLQDLEHVGQAGVVHTKPRSTDFLGENALYKGLK